LRAGGKLSIIIALVMISIIVVVHEFGHYLFAKINGIGVKEFAVGMGPKIVGFQKKETYYSLKLLPIGGACIMEGEDGEEANNSETSFNKKGVWARISVVLAGPVFNFVLAFLLAVCIISIIGYDTTEIKQVIPDYPAAEAGLQAGDKIVQINNKKMVIYRDIRMYTTLNPGEVLNITFERDGERQTVELTPKYSEESGAYLIGITGGEYVKATPWQTIKYAAYEVKYWIEITIKSIGMLFQGQVHREDVAGPVGIVNMIDETYEQSKPGGVLLIFINMASFAILLSANLGVMNLLPIPALDGGRLIFLLLEVIRRKPVDQKAEGMVHFVGFVCLMILMVVVFFNDLSKIFS
jgi:regulator of sigma E protease